MLDTSLQTHPVLLQASVFAASTLQAASGIGFGVIAGPLIMIAMNDMAAVQVSILLSFLVAVLLAPSSLRRVDRALLGRLVAGTVLGAPLGIAAFSLIDIGVLKVLAAIVTIANVVAMIRMARRESSVPESRRQTLVGMVSGIMGTSLAMPGPVVAAYLSVSGWSKDAVRSGTLSLFLCSYPIAYAAQSAVVGPSRAALDFAWSLAPASLLVPLVMVIGRSVSARRVRHGTPM